MIQNCWVCSKPIYEGDHIVAAMESVYHELPSAVSYAVDKPVRCLGLVHRGCYNDEDDE